MDTMSQTQNNITKQENNPLINDEFVSGKKSSRVKDETSEILARHRSPKKIPVIAYKNRQTRQSESFCVDQRYKSNNYFQLPQECNQIDGISTSQNHQQMQIQATQLVMEPQFSPIPQTSNFLGTDEDVDATTAICQYGSSCENSLADRKSCTQFANTNNNKILPTSEILHQIPANRNPMVNMNVNTMINQQLVNNYTLQKQQQQTSSSNQNSRSMSHSESKQSKPKNNQPKSKRNKRKSAQSCSNNQEKTSSSNNMITGQNSSKKQSNNSAQAKYKTVLCHHFEQYNRCPVGMQCQFAHGKIELRTVNDPLPYDYRSKNNQVILLKSNYKTERCKNMQTQGYCKFGVTCCFAHADHELRSLVDPEPMLIQPPANQFMSGCISDFDINSNQGGFLSQPISRRDSFNDMMSSSSSQVDVITNDIMSLQAQDPDQLQDFDIEIREQDIAVHDFSQQQSPVIPTPKIVCNFPQPAPSSTQTTKDTPQPQQQQNQANAVSPLVQPLQQVLPKKQKSTQSGTVSNNGNVNQQQNQTQASQANATRIGAVYNNPMIDMINQATNFQQDPYYNQMQQDPQQLQANRQQPAMMPMPMPMPMPDPSQDIHNQQQQQMMSAEQQQQMFQYQQDIQYQQQDMQAAYLQNQQLMQQQQQHANTQLNGYPQQQESQAAVDGTIGNGNAECANTGQNMDQYPDPLPAVHPNGYTAQQMQMMQQQQQQQPKNSINYY